MTETGGRSEHDSIPEIALGWHRTGRGAVLATVIETWGSAPRQAGSQLAVSGEGEIMGSVSGGCVEGAVVTEAGTIRVLVEPVGIGLTEDLLAELVAARAARQPRVYAVHLGRWERRLVGLAYDPLTEAAAVRLRSDRSGLEEGDWFLAVHNPGLRMVIVGAVHIAQALAPMARACGYEVTLIDPRETFGAAARFPGERILDEWPDAALASLGPDARTAVVTLTHDTKLDDPAIRAALASDVFYLGCLGSTRTHAKRLDRLRAAGVPDAQLARIHAPVGLDIGAKTPAEIAVSVLAQITQVLRQGA